MNNYKGKFQLDPQPLPTNSSHSSLTPTGELATQSGIESSSQLDTLMSPEKEKELCSKKRFEQFDRIIRHALRESLESVLPSLRDQDAGFASLMNGFEAKIKKKTRLYKELAYIPCDDLRFKSEISHWKMEFRHRALTIQTTAEPVESNADNGSQTQEGGVTDGKSICLEGTAKLDIVTGTEKWRADTRMRFCNPEELASLDNLGGDWAIPLERESGASRTLSS